jgi:DNA polymerase-3 subunit delta
MPAPARAAGPLALVFGDDEYAVKTRAAKIYDQWRTEAGGLDHEIIDASASNSAEALKSLARLRESLQTLPFFGTAKVIWFKNCNFLGEERTAEAKAVAESLGALAAELKEFAWENVRLLITSGKIDKRKTFYKTLEKIASVENLSGWSVNDRDWADQAGLFARRALSARGKSIDEEALGELTEMAGADPRSLESEIEKLSIYAGDRPALNAADVEAIVTKGKQARAFALGDALGERNLPRVLRCLDEELWEMKTDSKRSSIGLLYGLISKVRSLLFLHAMTQAGWIKGAPDYNRFKAQLGQVPADAVPEDKRFNPLGQNPYVLFKALPQIRNYSPKELVGAMRILLECNQKLVSSNADDALILQRVLVEITACPPVEPTPKTPRLAAAR